MLKKDDIKDFIKLKFTRTPVEIRFFIPLVKEVGFSKEEFFDTIYELWNEDTFEGVYTLNALLSDVDRYWNNIYIPDTIGDVYYIKENGTWKRIKKKRKEDE